MICPERGSNNIEEDACSPEREEVNKNAVDSGSKIDRLK